MRLARISLLLLAFAPAACAGALPASNVAGMGIDQTRLPMRLHAMAVVVCPTPPSATPSPAGGQSFSECTSEERTDVPALANSPTLHAYQIPGYHPSDIQSAYALPSVVKGQGQTVAIVIPYDDPDAEIDMAVYRKIYFLPPCTAAIGCFAKYGQDGSKHLAKPNVTWAMELSVDLDMVSAACPNCRIAVVEAASDNPHQLLQAMQTAATRVHANVISISWVTPEAKSYAGLENLLASFHTPIVAAAGDNGYGAAWPADSASAIAVGGTTLVRSATARGWSESVWSGTGGGCSAYIPKPAWQTDDGCLNRTMNDVSALADPGTGVAVFDSFLSGRPGGWLVFGGTSVAAPIVAGAIALAANSLKFSNASYIAARAALLNKVLSGSDGSCSTAYLCTGVAGYSAPAGYGSPNGVQEF